MTFYILIFLQVALTVASKIQQGREDLHSISKQALRTPRRALHVQAQLHNALIESPQQFVSLFKCLGVTEFFKLIDNKQPYCSDDESGGLLLSEVVYLHDKMAPAHPAQAGPSAAAQSYPRVGNIKQEDQGGSPGNGIVDDRQVFYLPEVVSPLSKQ